MHKKIITALFMLLAASTYVHGMETEELPKELQEQLEKLSNAPEAAQFIASIDKEVATFTPQQLKTLETTLEKALDNLMHEKKYHHDMTVSERSLMGIIYAAAFYAWKGFDDFPAQQQMLIYSLALAHVQALLKPEKKPEHEQQKKEMEKKVEQPKSEQPLESEKKPESEKKQEKVEEKKEGLPLQPMQPTQPSLQPQQPTPALSPMDMSVLIEQKFVQLMLNLPLAELKGLVNSLTNIVAQLKEAKTTVAKAPDVYAIFLQDIIKKMNLDQMEESWLQKLDNKAKIELYSKFLVQAKQRLVGLETIYNDDAQSGYFNGFIAYVMNNLSTAQRHLLLKAYNKLTTNPTNPNLSIEEQALITLIHNAVYQKLNLREKTWVDNVMQSKVLHINLSQDILERLKIIAAQENIKNLQSECIDKIVLVTRTWTQDQKNFFQTIIQKYIKNPQNPGLTLPEAQWFSHVIQTFDLNEDEQDWLKQWLKNNVLRTDFFRQLGLRLQEIAAA